MWTQMINTEPSVFERKNEEGVKRVLTSKGLYAFMMESTTLEYEMEKNCDLIQVGRWLETKHYGIGMPISKENRLQSTPLQPLFFRRPIPHPNQPSSPEDAGKWGTPPFKRKVVEAEKSTGEMRSELVQAIIPLFAHWFYRKVKQKATNLPLN